VAEGFLGNDVYSKRLRCLWVRQAPLDNFHKKKYGLALVLLGRSNDPCTLYRPAVFPELAVWPLSKQSLLAPALLARRPFHFSRVAFFPHGQAAFA